MTKFFIKSFFIIASMLLININIAYASGLDSMIHKSEFDKTSTIAVSVKDADTGRTVYEYNEQKLLNPASVQKIFTMYSAFNELGSDYKFKTTAYMDKNNNLYLKLAADPTLTRASLVTLLKSVKAKSKKPVNDIILDPTVIDNKQWGIGWMWDDDTSPLLPKYSPFSVNENKIEITLVPGRNGSNPEIKNKSSYQIGFVNQLKNGNENKIELERHPWATSDLTYIKGTIKSETKISLPVSSPERYFTNELNAALAGAGINHKGALKVAPIPKNATKIAEMNSSSLDDIIGYTLKNSNNFYSEMIFKAAAAHYTKSQGSTANAVKMLEKVFSSVKPQNHIIVDACGISRNNLLTVDWITSALNQIYKSDNFDEYEVLLPKPMEGTMADRLLNISLKLRAKTGTASGISSIAGYIETKSKHKYSFAIIIQNYNTDIVDVKKFEDDLINEIYKM